MGKYETLAKKYNLLDQRLAALVPINDPSLDELRNKLEGSFHEFIRWSWGLIESVPFVDGWHIGAVAKHLELCYEGKIRQLIINVPPGTMKSTILSMFNAWVWTKSPHYKFLCVSGTKRIALKDSDRCKMIIESDSYQNLWGDKVKIRFDAKSKQAFVNTKHGHRLAYSMLASVRGEGGNFIVIDDGNSDMDYLSDVTRESKNDYLDSNLYLRLRGSDRTCLINVQQRIHSKDLTGHMLAKTDSPVVHLRLPMEYKPAYGGCVTVPLKDGDAPWQDPRTEQDELLWPQGLTFERVREMKVNLRTEYNRAGQLQQDPAPRTGGLLKLEWIKWWKQQRLPANMYVVTSIDTAITTGIDSCYSAIVTIGLFEDDTGYTNVILLNCWRDKLLYPDLKKMIKRVSQDWSVRDLNSPLSGHPPHVCLIEKAANGESLAQDLWNEGVSLRLFNPRKYGLKAGSGSVLDSSKITRANIAASVLEHGLFWIRKVAPQYDIIYPSGNLFLECLKLYPKDVTKDVIDAFSQSILWSQRHAGLAYPGQKPKEDVFSFEQYRVAQRVMEQQNNLLGRV